MKKLVLSLLTALMAVCTIQAQTSLVATLNHEGNITAFYGRNALSDAHTAAVNGDIITLSSGTFNACDITKAVTIRGAGMEYNDGLAPTILQNDFYVYVAADSTNVLTMEGIYHNNTMYMTKATKSLFFKCRFSKISTYSTGNNYSSSVGSVRDASFIHCKVSTYFYLAGGDNVSFDNCVVNNPTWYSYSPYTANTNYYFTNCVLRFNGNSCFTSGNYAYPSRIGYSSLKNCIIYSTLTDDSKNAFPLTTVLYNNVSNQNCFINSANTTNTVEADFTKLFKTWTGANYSDEEAFDLTDTAVAKYLGDDGKQVGIYGGSLPFDPVPTHPKITKCDVAAKTTADGKLSVDIEVKGADY